MLAAAKQVHAARPNVRFLVASFNEQQALAARQKAEASRLPIECHVGRTPEIIELAACCISVSGSVSLELMYRLKPAVILYKVGRLFWLVGAYILLASKYITLVNLLAGEEVYPEYPTCRDRSSAMAAHVLTWLNDPAVRAERVQRLRKLRDELARPGACDRAAA